MIWADFSVHFWLFVKMMIAEALKIFIVYAVFFLRLQIWCRGSSWTLVTPQKNWVVRSCILPFRKVRDIVTQYTVQYVAYADRAL